MYDFDCNFIERKFDAELLFTDTDSLTYEIKSEDVYEAFYKHKHCLISVTMQKIQCLLFWQVNKLMTK